MAKRLPRRIVLPRSAVRYCATWMLDEFFVDHPYSDNEVFELELVPTTDDLRLAGEAFAELLSCPVHRRRQASVDLQKSVAACVRGRLAGWLRLDSSRANWSVHTVSLLDWWTEGVEPAAVGHTPDNDLLASLVDMPGYCDWLDGGGDADLGRYLGMWACKMSLDL